MRVLKNILITLGLGIGSVVVGLLVHSLGVTGLDEGKVVTNSVWLMILATGLWAAISSSRLEFRRYRTSFSYHPVTIFLVHLLLWVVVFPWFLTVRHRIKEGSAELKDEFKHEVVPPAMPPTMRRPAASTPPPVSISQPIPPPLPRPQGSTEDRFQQLQRLAQLRDQGILTESEFQAEKRKVLEQA